MDLYIFLFYRNEHDKTNQNLAKEFIHGVSFVEALTIWKKFDISEKNLISIHKHFN